MGSHGELASLFRAQSREYALFRPNYPPELIERVFQFARLSQRGLAVDLGCGSGQATADLAPLFQRVVGLDASAEQLAHAPGQQELPNAEFRCRPVENTGLPSSCADLVTAATSLHWFEQPAAYHEVRRLLKPEGALAAWTYTPWACLPAAELQCPSSSPEAARQVAERAQAAEQVQDGLVQTFWPFFHPRLQRLLLDRSYSGYLPPEGVFQQVELGTLEMRRDMTVAEMAGWVRSWSAFAPYCRQHGEAAGEAVLERYTRDMVACLELPNEQTPVPTRWPILLLLARTPAAPPVANSGGGSH